MIDRIVKFLQRFFSACEHKWRPISIPGGCGRWCEKCDTTQKLTREEFYAHFGSMPHRWY